MHRLCPRCGGVAAEPPSSSRSEFDHAAAAAAAAEARRKLRVLESATLRAQKEAELAAMAELRARVSRDERRRDDRLRDDALAKALFHQRQLDRAHRAKQEAARVELLRTADVEWRFGALWDGWCAKSRASKDRELALESDMWRRVPAQLLKGPRGRTYLHYSRPFHPPALDAARKDARCQRDEPATRQPPRRARVRVVRVVRRRPRLDPADVVTDG